MTAQKKFNLSVIIFVVFGLLLIVFGIFPALARIKKNSQELILQREKFVSLGATMGNLDEFKKDYSEMEPDFKKIDALFVNSQIPLDFIGFLEDIARESQTAIKISPLSSGASEREKWLFLDFQIISTGSFPNFLRFLGALENGPYLIEIQNLKITKTEEGSATAVIFLRVFAK